MPNWQAVSNHLAIEVMGWHIVPAGERGSMWANARGGHEVLTRFWLPHQNWRRIGMVIDGMKESNYPYLSLFCSIRQKKFGAYFYSLDREGALVTQDTEQEAIALAAALATGYVEEEEAKQNVLKQDVLRDDLLTFLRNTRKKLVDKRRVTLLNRAEKSILDEITEWADKHDFNLYNW